MSKPAHRPSAARRTPRARVAAILLALCTAGIAAACTDPTAPTKPAAHPVAGQAQHGGAPRTSGTPQDSTRPDSTRPDSTPPDSTRPTGGLIIWW